MTSPVAFAHMLRHGHLLSFPGAEQIMGMPALEPRTWTLEEFETARDAAPQGERWELIDGSVYVTPSPNRRHQVIVRNLVFLLDAYVRKNRLGVVLFAPLDVRFRVTRVVQPDVLVIPPSERERTAFPISLLLAAEVLSPSSARIDRIVKRPVYQDANVSEYWIIDDDARLVERWQPGDERPAVIADRLTWHPAGATERLVIELAELFEDPFAEL